MSSTRYAQRILSTPGASPQQVAADLIAFHRAHFGDARMEDNGGGSEDGDGEGQAPTDGDNGEQTSSDKGYPPNTPLAEMTDAQQAAYWRAMSRKHESRASARHDYDEIKAELEQRRQADETEHEAAVREAREAGAAEARGEAVQQTVTSMARMALRARGVEGDDIDAFITETNLTAFVTDDGQVDDERLAARVDRYAGTASGTGRWPGTGQDRRGGTSKESGRDLHARLHGSKK